MWKNWHRKLRQKGWSVSDILRKIIVEGAVPEESERAKELLDKLSEYKLLAKVEEMEEQNYNMIDNVLNNGAEKTKKEADRKEMDKSYGRVWLLWAVSCFFVGK